MKKINWESVKGVAELIGGFVCYGLVIVASQTIVDKATEKTVSPIAGYDDAVGAIMKSGMYSHDKANAIESLKQNGNPEFYRAIIHIAKDDSMYSHNKVDMIKRLSQD